MFLVCVNVARILNRWKRGEREIRRSSVSPLPISPLSFIINVATSFISSYFSPPFFHPPLFPPRKVTIGHDDRRRSTTFPANLFTCARRYSPCVERRKRGREGRMVSREKGVPCLESVKRAACMVQNCKRRS